MYSVWYYNNERIIKKTLVIACPVITFVAGLLISPLLRGEKTQEVAVGYTDTIMIRENGSKYEGTVLSGTDIRSGYGTLTFSNGTVYEGEWKDDRLKYGTRTSESSVYRGSFNDMLQNDGFGIIEYTESFIRKKQKNMTAPDHIVKKYIGNWKNDTKEGLGRSFKADGSIEFGIYKDGSLLDNACLGNVETAVYGIDLSHYQTDIDWDNLALYSTADYTVTDNAQMGYLQPVSFVYLKATEGATMHDKMYSVRAIEADRHGIVKGAYHFLHLKTSIDDQMKNFIETVSWVKGDMPPALDVECVDEIREMGEAKLFDYVDRWLTGIEQHFHVKPIIYTTEEIQNKLLTNGRFSKRLFWIAKPGKMPSIDNWQIWQQSHTGCIKGCDGPVDINKFNGDYNTFLSYLNNQK